MRSVFRGIADGGLGAVETGDRRGPDDDVGMIVIGEDAVADREVTDGGPFLEIPFGRGEDRGLEAAGERAAFDRAMGRLEVEALRAEDLELAVADDGPLPHRRHVDEPVDAIDDGRAAEVAVTFAGPHALRHDVPVQSQLDQAARGALDADDHGFGTFFLMPPIPELHPIARPVVDVGRLDDQGARGFLRGDPRVIGQDVDPVVIDLGEIALLQQECAAQAGDLPATRAGIKPVRARRDADYEAAERGGAFQPADIETRLGPATPVAHIFQGGVAQVGEHEGVTARAPVEEEPLTGPIFDGRPTLQLPAPGTLAGLHHLGRIGPVAIELVVILLRMDERMELRARERRAIRRGIPGVDRDLAGHVG